MSWRNRVIWSEGLFLRPQHLQQNLRYIENFVEGRCLPLRNNAWGLRELTVDGDLLRIGKLGISSAAGVFPDGTPFNIPEDDPPPAPLDLDQSVRDARVLLALPVRRQGMQEVSNGAEAHGLARYRRTEAEIADVCTPGMASAAMEVGALKSRLLLQSDERQDYSCIGVAHVQEVHPDRSVQLREDYIPTVINARAAPRLAGFMTELNGLLHARGQELAGRVSEAGRGTAEIADFLLLMIVNRHEPLVGHLAALDGLHPEDLYRELLMLAGELATLTSTTRRPREFPVYAHHDLRKTFDTVMVALREAFSTSMPSRAMPLPLEQDEDYGIHISPLTGSDRTLLKSATFVLAARADMSADELLKRFPATVKVGSVEKIHNLVNLHLPGIALRPLAVAPRQIPFHTGFAYFELERGSQLWSDLENSGGFAIQIGSEFPGLELEFWAIRGK